MEPAASGAHVSPAFWLVWLDALCPDPLWRTGNSDGAVQLLPLLEEALMAVETLARATSERKRHGAAMVLEPLREEAPMAVESGMGATSATMVLEPLRKEALTDVDRL